MFGRLVTMTLFCALLIIVGLPSDATAKEIEVTDEWQLVGENDTLPAGMHVRMDLTTGEKWVKRMDPEENGGAVTITNDGSVANGPTTPGSTNSQDTAEQPPAGDEESYDFDMMHRTLAQLPDDEQHRMGGLPELPTGKTVASLSPRERELFETRMKQIWKQRQAELRELEKKYVAELPQVLKDRIESIREYLEDPVQHLTANNLAEHSGTTDDDDATLDNIVAILDDLEFLLTDIDMARDFHTLGGWNLLVTMLAEKVHSSPGTMTPNRNLNDTDISDAATVPMEHFASSVQMVQAHAAWVLGTAVKNTGEFIPWALESVVVETKHDNSRQESNALELVHQTLQSSLSQEKLRTKSLELLQQKLVYALGSFLRGNPLAQFQFAQQQGPVMLARSLELWTNDETSKHSIKMMQRVISMASDILLELRQQQTEPLGVSEEQSISSTIPRDQMNQITLEAFSDTTWCHFILQALESGPRALQSSALNSLPSFEGNCQWDALPRVLATVKNEWLRDTTIDAEDFSDQYEIMDKFLGQQ
mmetsp:Transcript_8169/g.18337  ORF Transcript_8169/g.18337 Transcript_8169/m.18337 type:complete len:535 (-) Transcript_8169:104-1708(-)